MNSRMNNVMAIQRFFLNFDKKFFLYDQFAIHHMISNFQYKMCQLAFNRLTGTQIMLTNSILQIDVQLDWIILIYNIITQNMTLQFRQKIQDTHFEQIQKQNKLLKEYNLALEKENNSRNQERKLLQAQLDRLLQKQKQTSMITTSTAINISESNQYVTLLNKYNTSQHTYWQLQQKYNRLSQQNISLLFKLQTYEFNQTTSTELQKENQSLKSNINSLETRIYQLEAQSFTYYKQSQDLKIRLSNSKTFEQSLKSYEEKVNQLQKSLNVKISEINRMQLAFNLKQQQLNKQKKLLKANISDLQTKLRQKSTQQSSKNEQRQDFYLRDIMSLQIKNEEMLRQIQIKNNEILKLKTEINQKLSVSQRNDDLFRQISLHQDEITRLKNQLSDKNIVIKKKQDFIVQLSRNQQEMYKLKSQITQKGQIQSRYEELVLQLNIRHQEIAKLKLQLSQKVSNFSSQIYRFQQKLFEFQQLVKSKDEQIHKLKSYTSLKQDQLSKLNRDIASYLTKINHLSNDLDKLQQAHRSHTSSIKNVQTEQINILRSKIEQVNSINIGLTNKIQHFNTINLSLSNTIAILEKENIKKGQYIKDLERRVNILEDTNRNLQNELRSAIQSKKSASTLKINQNQQAFKNTIKSLKGELEQLASSYQFLKLQNNQLYNQLQIARNQKHICHVRSSKSGKSRSKSPHTKKVDIKYNKLNEITFHPAMNQSMPNNKYQIFTNTVSYVPEVNRTQMISPLNSQMYKTSPQNMQNTNNRYSELQKKIKMLQNENQALRQHFV